MPRGDSARSQSQRSGDRQPERQERRFGPQETEQSAVCADRIGYDAGKKIKGEKRHLLVDTVGLLPHAAVHPANIQDRDGGVLVLASPFDLYPFLQKLFADAGYQEPQFRYAAKIVTPAMSVEIVKRSDQAECLTVLPKRWVVERTLASLGRGHPSAKDFEWRTRNSPPSCCGPPSASCSGDFVTHHELSGWPLSVFVVNLADLPAALAVPWCIAKPSRNDGCPCLTPLATSAARSRIPGCRSARRSGSSDTRWAGNTARAECTARPGTPASASRARVPAAPAGPAP